MGKLKFGGQVVVWWAGCSLVDRLLFGGQVIFWWAGYILVDRF